MTWTITDYNDTSPVFIWQCDNNVKVLRVDTIILKLTVDVFIMRITATNEQLFYGTLIYDNPGEPVSSQRKDLLEQQLDFMNRMSFLPLNL